MAKNRQLETRFRKDTYIKSLRPNEKYLFVYLLTNSFTNIAGVYEIGIDEIMIDTKLLDRQIKSILKKLEKDGKIIYKNNRICIRNFIKYQSKSPTIVQGIAKELEIAPDWFIKDIGIQIPEIKETKIYKKKKKITKKYVVEDETKPNVDKEKARQDILKFKNK